MKAAAIVNRGIEEIGALEIKEIIGAQTAIHDSILIFEVNDLVDLVKLAYQCQSIRRILLLIDSFNIKNLNFNEILLKIRDINFQEILSKFFFKNTSFRVKSEVETNNKKSINIKEINNHEIDKEIGAIIINKVKKSRGYSQKVNLSQPDVTIFVYITGNNLFIGIDFVGFDLSKRDYKVFPTGMDLNATVGYSLIRISNYNKDKVLLDPFCGSGVIPIEAALYNNKKINSYRRDKFAFRGFPILSDINFDKLFDSLETMEKHKKIFASDPRLPYMRATSKNAKIAGVDKEIKFSRIDIEWLDTKFGEKEIDCVVTYLPFSKNNAELSKKQLDNFFYALEYILKDDGVIGIISKHREEVIKSANKYGFKIKLEKEVWQGNLEMSFLLLEKIK